MQQPINAATPGHRAPWWRRLEIPTWLVVVLTYGGWVGVTWWYNRLPGWLVVPLAAGLLTLHGSLQHEAIHGHPTRSRRINTWIAGVPLSLWLPYPIYRESHLRHHRISRLTDPIEDPESYYFTSASWQSMGSLHRALRHAMSTLFGRMIVGPAVVLVGFFAEEWRALRSGNRRHGVIWLTHLARCALVLAWVLFLCRIPLAAYLALFVGPGLSLTLVRSFTEHRPSSVPGERTAIVEAGPLLGLLFLNNNLHAVHHAAPELPWYELPERYRRDREAVLSGNGHFYFRSYGEIFRRYALRTKDLPVHPDT